MIGPSLRPARLAVVAASAPLTMLTTTAGWLPSLNDTLPLSSVSIPATVNGTAPAIAVADRVTAIDGERQRRLLRPYPVERRGGGDIREGIAGSDRC